MKIAITGHRPNKLGNDYDLTSALTAAIRARILLELRNIMSDYKSDIIIPPTDVTLITGMAQGIDTLFAKIAIDYGFQFIAAIPCWNQDKMWPPKAKEAYSNILANWLCTIQLVTPSEYTPQCMQIRNQWMVDNCDVLIAVWDGSKGGTANCVKYAQQQGKDIIRINPKEL